ncbi:hypothetical protein MNV49_007503 [Pseudohyphozyma bogoriensis]|nr:hypothetical protein MNV49_007503 [Pseudohyphozyma bogoriensis]
MTEPAPSSSAPDAAAAPASKVYPSSLPPEAIAYARQFFDHARKGDVEACRAPLEAGLPPNLTNEKGDTLLMLATYHGHAALTSLLLSHGADPNRLNDRGQSPLAGAVFKNETEIINLLLEGGADPYWGQPSAVETAGIFGKSEEWREKFEGARGRGSGGVESAPFLPEKAGE